MIRNNNISLLLLLISALAFSGILHAQTFQPDKNRLIDNWRINLNTGSSIFYGDLKDEGLLPYDIDYKLGYGFIIRKQFTPSFSIGGQIYNSKLKSTDKFIEEGIEKTTTFEADVFEYNLHLLFDFVPLIDGYTPDRNWSAYMFLGWGLSNWKTIVRDYHSNEILRTHGFTGKGPGKRTTELVMPVGLGMRYNLNNHFGITFETALHPVNSDFLDATGGGFSYDMYHYSSLGISFFLNAAIEENDRSREVVRIKKRQARRKSRQSSHAYNEPSSYYYQDIQRAEPVDQSGLEMEKSTDISEFKKKYAESDLPVVSEYNIRGVFGREDRKAERASQQQVLPELQTDQNINNRPHSRTLTFTNSSKKQFTSDNDKDVSSVIFGVQILATTSVADLNMLRDKYNIEEEIKSFKSNGLTRYVVLAFPSHGAAAAYASILHDRGLKDAFVVAYRNGKRVDLNATEQ